MQVRYVHAHAHAQGCEDFFRVRLFVRAFVCLRCVLCARASVCSCCCVVCACGVCGLCMWRACVVCACRVFSPFAVRAFFRLRVRACCACARAFCCVRVLLFARAAEQASGRCLLLAARCLLLLAAAAAAAACGRRVCMWRACMRHAGMSRVHVACRVRAFASSLCHFPKTAL